MDVYLPIANLSVNALVMIALGAGVGLLSGMFGVGGGFLTTPLLIVYGIPPTVAAASAASQVTGASVSGVFAHFRRGGVDVKMGAILVAGTIASLAGMPLPGARFSSQSTTKFTAIASTAMEAAGITDPADRDCGIARPIRVTEILPGLALEGGADMRCDTARALAHWTRDFVQPAAARLPGAPRVTAMTLGTTYFCRPVVGGASTSRLSEHAVGNAIDIAAFRFDDGTDLTVAPREDSGDLLESFQAAVRASARAAVPSATQPSATPPARRSMSGCSRPRSRLRTTVG